MSDLTGKTISHYNVISRIGQGGMGVVYKAEDTKLDRFVALKFLPPYVGEDEEKKKRFVQEAKAASALDHPNICTIYEINETEDGRMYIAMAYYEGQTLKERVAAVVAGFKPAPTDVINIIIKIGSGLERAHRRGIVHRDIKPANIIITPEGTVKILDFGLAKVSDIKLTQTGSTLGTVAYMAPEQIQAEAIDQRADIWSLGVILYEMLAGQLPFQGEFDHAVMYAIMNVAPVSLKKLNPAVSEKHQAIIEKALAKDKSQRYPDMCAFLKDLKALNGEIAEPQPPFSEKQRKRSFLPILTVGLMIAFLAAIGSAVLSIFSNGSSPGAPQNPIRASHRQLTFIGDALQPVLSPDGQFIAYKVGEFDTVQAIRVQDLAGGEPLEIYRGKLPPYSPLRWSPDGSDILINGNRVWEGRLIPRLGGTSRTIKSGFFLTWSPDGREIASSFMDLDTIWFTDKISGRIIRKVYLDRASNWIQDLDWSPSGDRLCFILEKDNIHKLLTIRTDGTQRQQILEDSTDIYLARWSGDGQAIYYLSDSEGSTNLMKIHVSPINGKAEGASQILHAAIPIEGLIDAPVIELSISKDNKKLLYPRVKQHTNLWRVALNAPDKLPASEQITSGTYWNYRVSISPDGGNIAFTAGKLAPYKKSNIVVMAMESREKKQLTFSDAENYNPVWSPDGNKIAYISNQEGDYNIWLINADGTSPIRYSNAIVSKWGQLMWAPYDHILFHEPGNRKLLALNPESKEQRPFLSHEKLEYASNPLFSPDQKQVILAAIQQEQRGYWLTSLIDSTYHFLSPLETIIAKWSRDGKWLYVFKEESPDELYKMPLAGGELVFVANIEPPRNKLDWQLDFQFAPDETWAIYSSIEKQSDLWLIENFDPEVTNREKITGNYE